MIATAALVGIAFALASQGLAFPYVALFLTSLVAGSALPFVPGSSEMAMAGFLTMGAAHPAALIATALFGNIAGASTNYAVGMNIARFSGRRWFPITERRLSTTAEWFGRYGVWLLLMCWLPTAGDAITVVAGFLKAELRLFLVLTAIGKTFGHLAVAVGVTWL